MQNGSALNESFRFNGMARGCSPWSEDGHLLTFRWSQEWIEQCGVTTNGCALSSSYRAWQRIVALRPVWPRQCAAMPTWSICSSTRPSFVPTSIPSAPKKSGSQEIGQSRGGLTTFLHRSDRRYPADLGADQGSTRPIHRGRLGSLQPTQPSHVR